MKNTFKSGSFSVDPYSCGMARESNCFCLRNHNALGTIEQDPGVFGEEVARY